MGKLDKAVSAVVAGVLGVGAASQSASAAIVINEIYGAGGNSGALLDRDFFELFNNSTTETVNIGGYALQYASATGLFASSTSNNTTLPSFDLPPLTSYLITGAAGTNGASIGTGNFTSGIAAAATAGKLRLLDAGGTLLDLVGFGSTAVPNTNAPTGTNIGFTTSLGFEGTGPAPAPSTILSISRLAGLDTDSNATDFTTGTPTPVSAPVPEPAGLGILAAVGGLLLGKRRR